MARLDTRTRTTLRQAGGYRGDERKGRWAEAEGCGCRRRHRRTGRGQCFAPTGLQVDVYEQASSLGEVGAGIFVYRTAFASSSGWASDPPGQVGAPVGEGSKYRRMDGTIVGSIITQDSSGWNGMYGMHRADILNALAAALPAACIHTNHKCVGFEQSDESAKVHFANGATIEADVVIAADGIRSALQPFVVEPSPPEYSGFRAYRGLVERDALDSWPTARIRSGWAMASTSWCFPCAAERC